MITVMAKDPAFLWYSSDFNTGTQFFTDEQVGKYVRLLNAQHQHGHLSEKDMLSICKAYDKHILSKFEQDSAGLYYNKRLEFEIERRKNYVASRLKNATSKKPYAKHMPSHMENENENEIINRNLNENATEKKGVKKTRKVELAPALFTGFVGAVLDAWNSWVTYRREAKKSCTPSTLKKHLEVLEGESDDNQIQIIDNAISGGWAKLFKLTTNGNGHNTKAADRGIDAGKLPGESWGRTKF